MYLLKSIDYFEKRIIRTHCDISNISNLLVTVIFNISEMKVPTVSVLNTDTADKLLESLHFDDNGRLSGK